jgi:hypothetical protein
MEGLFRDHLSWIGIREKLVCVCGVGKRLFVLTMTVIGENESEIMKLIRSVPKETEKA